MCLRVTVLLPGAFGVPSSLGSNSSSGVEPGGRVSDRSCMAILSLGQRVQHTLYFVEILHSPFSVITGVYIICCIPLGTRIYVGMVLA